MKHEYTEHEEKRNNGANSHFQLGEADRKHIAGIGVDVGHGVKAKVSKMAKESIKVERSENKKTTYEE